MVYYFKVSCEIFKTYNENPKNIKCYSLPREMLHQKGRLHEITNWIIQKDRGREKGKQSMGENKIQAVSLNSTILIFIPNLNGQKPHSDRDNQIW